MPIQPESSRVLDRIRLAAPDDAAAIQAIYAPVVADTIISFEWSPPTVDEMRRRLRDTLEHHPWLVGETRGQMAGYVYASRHRTRTAYDWSVDVSAYIHPDFRRRGIGFALYTSLFACLRLQGFYNAYAGIALPNPGSVGLHERCGFQPVGVYRDVGYKRGAWHDVGWWHLALQPKTNEPSAPLSLDAAQAVLGWPAALAAGLIRGPS